MRKNCSSSFFLSFYVLLEVLVGGFILDVIFCKVLSLESKVCYVNWRNYDLPKFFSPKILRPRALILLQRLGELLYFEVNKKSFLKC